MNSIINNKKIQQLLEITFKIGLLLYSIVSVNSFTYATPIISIILWPTVLLGGLLLCWRLFKLKEYARMPLLIWLSLMTISFAVSVLLNKDFGLKKNIIIIVLWFFYFFLVYTRDKNETEQSLIKELQLFSNIFLAYMFISVFISFVLMAVGYSNVYTTYDNYEIASGFIWGRLWGVFNDPNAAATMSALAVLLGIHSFLTASKRSLKVYYGVNIVLQISYIAFSDSRSGLIALGVGTGIFIFLGRLKAYEKIKGYSKYLKIILITLASMIFIMVIPKIIIWGYNNLDRVTESSEKEPPKEVKRGYDLEENISNRRFDLWKSGIEIFQTTPVVGTSYSGITDYAKENLPDTYLVNNDYKEFKHLDNEFLNVLVSQGIIGALILLILIFNCAVYILKRIFKVSGTDFVIIQTLLSGLCCMCVGVMFRQGMFYYNGPNTVMFWMLLGYLISLLRINSNSLIKVKE